MLDNRRPVARPATFPWTASALASILVVLAPASALAQEGTVQGRVRDGEGAPVFGAFVTLLRGGAPPLGADSDRLGAFRISRVPPGEYTLRVQALGWVEHAETVAVGPEETVEVEVELVRSALELQGVEVQAAASRERARFDQIAGATVREIDQAELRAVPGFVEADPVRAIEVLPGVVSTSDFSAAFHVRGGSADQNLILLDGVPVFSPFHLGGLFSVFNADMIDRVELQSGGFAAEHGGRVSSVLEIETDGGEGGFGADTGISLLATRVAAGGRLPAGVADALGHSSVRWRGSARRSYFDVLLAPAFEFPYHLQDFQLFMEGWSRGGDRLALTAYTGRDVLDLTRLDDEDFPLRIDWDWGNDVVGLQWTHARSGGGSLDVRTNFSRYLTGLTFPDFDDTEFSSRIQQGQVRVDLDTRPAPRLAVQVGSILERLSYRNRFATGGTEFIGGDGSGWLVGTYAQARWSAPAEWLVEAGVRFDGWSPDPGSWAGEVAPRLAVKRFFAGGDAAVKLAAGRYTQFLHSLRDEELPLGLDVWVLAGARAPHVVSDQLQLGVEGWWDVDWFWSVEGYVRSFDGVVTFNPSDDPNTDLDDILRGEGLSYGVDFLLRKETGSVSGWVAASLLRAERTFPDPLSPVQPQPEITYPPVFDRRLDVDLVLRYPLPWGWEGGLRWNFGTGIPYTRAVGSYAYYSPRFVQGGRLEWSGADEVDELGVVLEERNRSRYPVYHRLDWSARKTFRKSWGTLVPYVNVLNVYNRRNPLFYFFQYADTPPVRAGVSMFPVLPTFGLEVAF
ncbi:MAG TPA: TonB-dependent receptor [Longimicrobiales bacterium]|nr:TonB-dependent receptor [Longimicrobiales bacterium]